VRHRPSDSTTGEGDLEKLQEIHPLAFIKEGMGLKYEQQTGVSE